MIDRVVVASLLLAACATATAQVTPISTIQTVGEGTVEVPPDTVEFWLHKESTAAVFVEAFSTVLRFGPALRKELTERDLTPLDVSVTAPSIPLTGGRNARVSAKVQFSMSTFTDRETGPTMFAALCDQMLDTAAKLECLIEGPLFTVQDRPAVEQAAAALALEKALPMAQSLADLMSARVTAVDHVDVEEAAWNAAPDTRAALPDLRRLTCTVRVHVTYAFSATGE